MTSSLLPAASTMSMTQSSDCLDGSELGSTRVELPNNDGFSGLKVTTRLKGRSRLRHVMTELHQFRQFQGLFQEAELLVINGCEITSWSHSQVISRLNHHLSKVTETELKLTLRGRDGQRRKHIVEVTIGTLSEDGLGDTVRTVYDIILRVTDKIVTKPDVTDVMFLKAYDIRVRHGAMAGYFLKVGSDQTLCMDIPTSDSDDYVFKCYTFIGHDNETTGSTGDTGDGAYPYLCVLQEPHSQRCVAACAGPACLKMDDDAGFRTDITSITTPDCHFFVRYNCGSSGADYFCLRPLVMKHYFLRYDAVTGLTLKKCKPPPYRNVAEIRNFTFEFVPA